MKCKRLLFWNHRPDGNRIIPRDTVQQLMPYVMTTRNESCVYFRQQIDLGQAFKYIEDNQDQEKVTVFILMLTAMVRTASQYPRLNRFVVGKRIFARNSMQLSYIAKRDKSVEGSEVVIKQTFEPTDTVRDVAQKVNTTLGIVREGKDADSDGLIKALLTFPGFIVTMVMGAAKILNRGGLLPGAIIYSDPLFSSAFVANLGSIGAGAPFHHLYEWGTVSLFIVMGEYKKVYSYNSDGERETKTVVDVTFTIDERIADGYYFSHALKYFQGLVENPEQLEYPPERVIADE